MILPVDSKVSQAVGEVQRRVTEEDLPQYEEMAPDVLAAGPSSPTPFVPAEDSYQTQPGPSTFMMQSNYHQHNHSQSYSYSNEKQPQSVLLPPQNGEVDMYAYHQQPTHLPEAYQNQYYSYPNEQKPTPGVYGEVETVEYEKALPPQPDHVQPFHPVGSQLSTEPQSFVGSPNHFSAPTLTHQAYTPQLAEPSPSFRPPIIHTTSEPTLSNPYSPSTPTTSQLAPPAPIPRPLSTLSPSVSDASSPRPTSKLFSFSSSSKSMSKKGAAAVRTSVTTIVTELVQEPYKVTSAGVLDACQRACESANLSLAEILQEASMENHTPLYWAIIKATGSATSGVLDGPRALVADLLAHATPLTQTAASDVLLACTTSSDNTLYQICRPYLFAVDKADRLILGERGDYAPYGLDITPSADGFIAQLSFPLFHRRMRGLGRVGCEFTYSGRIFELTFSVTDHDHLAAQERQRRKEDMKKRVGPAIRPARKHSGPKSGTWVVGLSLLEHSAPTPLDARVVVQPTSASAAPALGQPALDLPLQTLRERLLSPVSKGKEIEEVWARLHEKEPSTAIFKSEVGPYVMADGTLQVTLNARLVPPEKEEGCVIC